jgi:hypothetical protein
MAMTTNEETSLFLHHILKGGVVNTGDLALSIARLLLNQHYRAEDVQHSEPFAVADKGDEWRIEGMPYLSDGDEGKRKALVRIAKRDGRIIDLVIHLEMIVPPEAQKIIDAAMRKKP